MKRCPECRRDYYDDTLRFCLADGSELVYGLSDDEPATAILHMTDAVGEAPTRAQIHTTEQTAVLPGGAEAESQRNSGELSERQSLSANRAAKPLVIFGVAVLFLIGGFFGYRYLGSNTKQIDSIAVLPFVNESGNIDVEYLSDGITESLINTLSQLPNLSVKARATVFHYKAKDVTPQKVGSELSVRAVLNGRVQQRGDELILSLELIDALTGNQIWGEHYIRKQADLISLQNEIARDVADKLKVKLSGADERNLTKNYPNSTEAYQLYLKGRFFLNQRTAESLKKSVEYFNQAIEKDPRYALAFAGMADAYSLFPGYSAGLPQESYSKAKAAARQALEIDETLAEAHTSLGVLLIGEWNLPDSNREFQRAIALNPNYPTAHHWYACNNLLITKRFDEAIAEGKRAQELDPLSLIINADLGYDYIYARQYDKAIEQLRKTTEMDQSFYYAHWQLGKAYELKGLFAEAIDQYQKARQLIDDTSVLAALIHVYAASGRRDDALKTLEQLKQTAKQRSVSPMNWSIAYAGLDDKDEAFNWLEKGYEARYKMAFLRIEPLFDNLRSDPRYADLVRRVGLPE